MPGIHSSCWRFVVLAATCLMLGAPLLSRADASFAMVPQEGHTQEVSDIVYSHRGEFIVTSARDQKIKLWTPDGRLIRTIATPNLPPRIAISPDDSMILSAGVSGIVEMWSVTGRLLWRDADTRNLMKFNVAFSPDQQYVVVCTTASKDEHCQIYGIGGQRLARLDKPAQGYGLLAGIAISPDGEHIFTAAKHTVTKWSRSGERVKEFKVSEKTISAMAVSPDGQRIAIGHGWESTLGNPKGTNAVFETRIWDADGKPIATFRSHNTRHLFFSSDSQWLISGGDETGEILIHDRNGHLVRSLAVGSRGQGAPAHVAISPDKQMLTVADHHFRPVALRLYNTNGALVRHFSRSATTILKMVVEPRSNVIVTTSTDNQVRYWGLDGRLLKRFSAEYDYPTALAIEPNGRAVAAGGSALTLWDGNGKKLAQNQIHKKSTSGTAAFSPDGKILYSGGSDGYLHAIPLTKDGKAMHIRPFDGKEVLSVAVHPDGSRIAVGSHFERIKILDVAGKVLTYVDTTKVKGPPYSGVHALQFTPDGQHLVASTTVAGQTIKIYDLNGVLQDSFDSGNRYSSSALTISSSGRWLASGINNNVGVWDLKARKQRHVLKGHRHFVTSVAFTQDERHLISASGDGTMRVWNLENGASYAMLSEKDEWVIYTDDGYFDASRRGSDLIALVRGERAYTIDQVANVFNRPDLIYERVGIGDSQFLEHFRNHYEERRRRAKLKAALPGEWSAPEVRVKQIRQQERELEIQVDASDARESLQAVQVFVNDVPQYPGLGKPVDGRTVQLSDRIQLSQGKNKIEVSAFNRLGVESLRAPLYVEYTSTTAGNLYFVGLGVSKYRDARLNLKFADNDVVTMAAAFSRYKKGFGGVRTLQLTNEQATRAALKEIRTFLASATLDDTVVLLVSGHGAYDRTAQATYRYLSHEADVNDLANTTISYDELEGLLGEIRPRSKLLLLDTCASGELDPAVLARIQSEAGTQQLAIRSGVQLAAGARVNRRTYLVARNRYIYNNLDRRSGSVVFSSSLGDELSLESPAIKNGVFTYAFLRILETPQADQNRDGYLSMDELEPAVKSVVVKATRDLQHPTIDRENIYQEFRLPLLQAAPPAKPKG